jgi:AraC family transcriptional regulator, arabinose operon regulatory protein
MLSFCYHVRMNYFFYQFNEENHHESIWFRRPDQPEDRKYPLMLYYAGYSRCSTGWQNYRKKSDIYAIEYVCEGNAFLIQDGKEYIINKGEIFILRKDAEHTYGVGPAGFLLKRFITFDGMELENLFRFLALWGRDTMVPSEPWKLEKLLKRFTSILSGQQMENTDILFSTMLYNLMLYLSLSVETKVPPLVDKAVGYLQKNLNRSVSREELSDYLGVSLQSANKLFLTYFKCSPIKYFIGRRMNWAMQLLTMTKYTIKEIASMIGYDDPLYFSAQFKKHFGVSPTNYRSSENKK